MSIYVFDSCAFIDLFKNYYVSRFPSLWKKFDLLLEHKNVTSVKEVYNEITRGNDRLNNWALNNKDLFSEPTDEEQKFIATIFQNPDFQSIVDNKKRSRGGVVADPFVIAKAKILDACVVTEEKVKSVNGIKIPTICKHFKIDCINLEQFMEKEKWEF